MRIPWTLSRYLLREVAGYTLIGLFAVGALLLLPSLLRRLEDLIALGITPAEAGRLLLLLAGRLAGYVLPFAFVFGVWWRWRGSPQIPKSPRWKRWEWGACAWSGPWRCSAR